MLRLLVLKFHSLQSQLLNLLQNVFLFFLHIVDTVFDHSFVIDKLIDTLVSLDHLLLIGADDTSHARQLAIRMIYIRL